MLIIDPNRGSGNPPRQDRLVTEPPYDVSWTIREPSRSLICLGCRYFPQRNLMAKQFNE